MKHKLTVAEKERDKLRALIEIKNRSSVMERLTGVDKLNAALKRAPKRLMEVIEDILRSHPNDRSGNGQCRKANASRA